MARDRKLIVNELLTKPSGVCPMLFVGLGGAGCKMVKRIASHLRARPDFRERYRELIKFAMVDTNVNDLESYREIADATFLISDFQKEEYANLASGKKFLEADEYFTQWVPSDYRFRSGDTAGAGQIRIESRLGVYYQMKHKDFVSRFRHLLEQLKSHEHGHRKLDSDEIRIVLCYSVAGGTGSGCHLPVAYMLQDQARDLGQPTLIGAAIMPAVFEDKVGVNKDGIYANGYAALKETEHLMKLGAPDSRFFPKEGLEFHYNPSDTSKRKVITRPFDFLYLIDKPESFSVPEPVDAAADGLYLQFFSPLYGAQLSDYDNYTQYQRFLVPEDFEERGIPGFSSFYGSFGCAVLLVPVPGLVEYCSQAAALALIRASFMGEIPADPVYEPLRIDSDRFYEVKERDEEDAQVFRAADIPNQQQKERRNRLIDRLFAKRVRLLAACEFRAGKDGRFRGIFRHGHYLGTEPRNDGKALFDLEIHHDEMRRERELVGGKLNVSIGGILLPALVGMPDEDPELLQRAQEAIKQYKGTTPPSEMRVVELKRRAARWRDDLKLEGLRRLREGYTEGTVRVPGMEELVELDFLRREAGEVDLTAKRYAVLSLLETIDWEQQPDEVKDSNFDVQDKKDTAKVRRDKDGELIEHVLSQARTLAFQDVRREFLAQLGTLKKALENYAEEMRELERGSTNLEREYSRRLERLQYQGEESANQYILDAEALQGEDNRRFWDFYFEDNIASMPELSLSNDRVQQILSDTVIDLSQRAGNNTSTSKLEKLFTALRKYAKEFLTKRIGGDRHSPDEQLREGLTLSDALEMEIIYRALYRSHGEEIQAKGGKVIRQVIAEYRALPEEKQIDFGEITHQDYLRDKIKRVVKEKASLLCVYDRSRDQHGGVRPDHVFLAAIDEDFKNSNIERALRGADIADLKWVSGNWHNAKEIIFYRAVLNVPLYTFGRMDELKHHYESFRNLKRPSKALHIDKNWEHDLYDLDPDTLKEEHRQKTVRDQIINFAALLSSRHPRLDGATCIVRRRARYYLLDPVPEKQQIPDDHDPGLTLLGDTLASAVQRLPEVLEAESVKFREYRDSLVGVRNGMAPELLLRISHLPFQWREQYEDLRNHYGHQRSVEQKEILKDLRDSYLSLQGALESLLEDLRNRQLESRTSGEDFSIYVSGLSSERAGEALGQSIKVLTIFADSWSKLGEGGDIPDTPESFKSLFQPLPAKELDGMLKSLRHPSSNNGDEDFDRVASRDKLALEDGEETEGSTAQPEAS
jgi:hypothetical protein